MALTITLDYALPELVERGFWRRFSTREIANKGNPTNDDSHKDVWFDAPTHTVMLKPQQLNPGFLNTELQLDSIIRFDDMVFSASDQSNGNIFEQPAFGNTNNPYIHHVPVGPATFFPSAVNPMPGAPPSVTGISTSYDTTDLSLTSQYQNLIHSVPTITPTPPYAAPVQIGSSADAKFVVESKARLAANQGLFVRWHQPASQLGYPAVFDFLVGQYCLRCEDLLCEIFLDTSAAGDRTSWRKIARFPLWGASDVPAEGVQQLTSMATTTEELAHDRFLLFLPYRRHQILVQSNTGKWGLLTVRPVAKRLADDSDWDITRSDTFALKLLTPAFTRIQVQKLKYPSGARKTQSPTCTLDYTPAVAPTIVITKDSDHGSTITAAQSQPPAYTLPANVADQCPPATTDPATDQSRTYGVELTLTASSDQRWTPFFYGFELSSPRTFGTRPTTPFTISDSHAATYYIQDATLTAGEKPGEGRLSAARVQDRTPFALSPYYYRSYYPVQVVSEGTTVFTGWSEPNEVGPQKLGSVRDITFSGVDRWKQLSDTFLLDQKDWSGYGHIDVVLFVAQQGGVDTTGAEVPAGYATGVLNSVNSPLNLGEQSIDEASGDMRVAWKPTDKDTAASYIQRVADIYSGWDVGFYPSGQFFYRPREYYTAPEVVFQETTAGGTPSFSSAQFRTVECEANVILVKSGSKEGGVAYSNLWVDWASIRNPAVVNYIGKWRAEVIEVAGSMSCAQLNLAARVIFQQTRRRHLTVEFEATFAPTLKVGHVCTLRSYGNYRITAYSVDFKKSGWRRANYSAELVERGYGLP